VSVYSDWVGVSCLSVAWYFGVLAFKTSYSRSDHHCNT